MKTNLQKSLLAIACLLCSIVATANVLQIKEVFRKTERNYRPVFEQADAVKMQKAAKADDTQVFLEDFEIIDEVGGPQGWVLFDEYVGEDGLPGIFCVPVYQATSGRADAFSGSIALASMYDSSNPRDAWAIAPGVELTAGVTYHFGIYSLCQGYKGQLDEWEVTIGNAQTIEAQTTVVIDRKGENAVADQDWTLCTGTFTPETTGTYYPAIHHCTTVTDVEMCLWDFFQINNTIVIDDIYYNISNEHAEVTYSPDNKYTGSIVIPENFTYGEVTYNVTSIGHSAFNGCTGLTEVTIGNSVTSIGNQAFSGCTGLKEVTIGNSVTSIGNQAFKGCSGLKEVTIGNSVISIGDEAFAYCTGLTEVTIPNSVTSIDSHTFYGCTGLTEVTIPNSITSIGVATFGGCYRLKRIEVEAENKVYDSRENCNAIIETATNTLIAGCSATVIPNSVTSIVDYAFFGCTGLTEVTIPNSVTSIGDFAFYGCTGLTEVTIGNSVTSIGYFAFYGCTGLTTIYCHATTPPTIHDDTFSSYTATLYVPVKSMDTYKSAEYWKNFAIERMPDCFVDGLYYYILSATDVEVTYKDNNYNSYSGTINIPETIEVEGVTYNVTSIGAEAFKGCIDLKEVTIPNSVTSIGEGAFYKCTGLKEITIPNSVTSIGSSAFSGCTGLTTIYCNATIPPSIYDDTFSSCTASLYVPAESVSAYKSADYWKNFTSINKYLVDGLYYNILSATDVEVTYKDSNYNSYSGTINIPETIEVEGVTYNVTSIGAEAFKGCIDLKEIAISNSVERIGNNAFDGCSGLRTVTIGSAVTEIGENAFAGCDRIKTVYCYAEVPPTIYNNTFTVYVNDNATLHLYRESQEAYAEADYWEYFTKIEIIKQQYLLTYMVDDTLYAEVYYLEGDSITPIAEPEKENYIFSGWSEIPEIMPSHDITVTGSFTFNTIINDNVSKYSLENEVYLEEITYIRNFEDTEWQTWYMPFDVDYTLLAGTLEVADINNVHQYDQNNDGVIDLTTIEAVLMKEGTLRANYPYLIKAHIADEYEIIAKDVTLQPTAENSYDCASFSHRFVITGTYSQVSAESAIANNYYALSGALFTPEVEYAIGAFRWYMTIENRGTQPTPARVTLRVAENYTDLESIAQDEAHEAEYYDLSGRRVEHPTRGIYIMKQGDKVTKVVL